ncbi:MAG: peptide chain release factor N(5)-glutamine methyltransferase [Nostocoides sp.]
MSTDAYAAVRVGTGLLADAGVPSPEHDAVLLLAHVRGVDAAQLRADMILRAPVSESEAQRFAGLLEERSRRVPLQHLTGWAPFRRLTLAVGPGVFVPRPETEVTLDHAIAAIHLATDSGVTNPVVVDLCTGSAAIAIALATECPMISVHAVELSREAHAWAERNVALHAPGVDLRLGDATTAFEDLRGRVDVVVANPPYIPDDMVPNDPEVRDHDPPVALYGGGADGLSIPRAVAARAAELLTPSGTLVMEHADVQGESLPAALRQAGPWRSVTDHLDLAGRPRVLVAAR